MLELSMKILCANGITKCVSCGIDEVHLVAALEYEEGDRIVIELDLTLDFGKQIPLLLWQL